MKCLTKGFLMYSIVLFVLFIETQSIPTATSIPANVNDVLKNTNITNMKELLNGSRRIMVGSEATTNRPYMVYLKLPVNNPKYQDYRRWLCGGVIIHEEYILTSAACIEDARHFYVVSGTYRHDEREDRYNNLCIKNGAKKAVWKCIPRNYVFDGHENDNIRWMNNDIAVVKVEDEFDFTRRIRGCDFVPKPVAYNNQSQRYEEPGNEASVAGWGSTYVYSDPAPTQNLLEATVKIIGKNTCKKRWGKRYHNIIENYMICSKDIVTEMSEICQEKYVDCTDIQYSSESGENRRRSVLNPEQLVLHSAYHNESWRRAGRISSGGFCEIMSIVVTAMLSAFREHYLSFEEACNFKNDHGGPLIYAINGNDIVIGIISACLVKERTNQCYGPFLYTSVFKNKNLISCAIYKDVATDCDKLFRSEITHTETEMSWTDHPDGPAKSELKAMRRKDEEIAKNSTLANTTTTSPDEKPIEVKMDKVKTSDKVEQHEGVIVRLFQSTTDNVPMSTDTKSETNTSNTKNEASISNDKESSTTETIDHKITLAAKSSTVET